MHVISRRGWLAIIFGLLLSVAPVWAAVCPTSPTNSTLSGGATTVLTDSSGHGWGIPVSGGPVFLSSTALRATSNAVQLAYVGTTVWYKNASNQWYSFNSSGGIASGPTTTSPLVATGPVPITAPLASAVPGSWSYDLHFAWPNSPSGLGYLVYNVLLPQGYDPTKYTYPVLFTGGGDGQGMNGPNGYPSYPTPGATFVNNTLGANYNTSAFRIAYPAIIVEPECDQSAGSSSLPNGNCGGYADSAMSGWNEQAINGLMAYIVANYSVTPGQHLFAGMSLSAIGYLAELVDNNSVTPVGSGLWDGGIAMSTQLSRPGTANSTIFPRMVNVPFASICSPGDNACNYDAPLCQYITGATCTQTKTQYDSGGMAAIRAGTSQFYYISSTNGGTAYGVFGPLPEGAALYSWLFNVHGNSSGGSGTGQFSISGGYLYDPTGAKFIPEGTNIADYNLAQVIQGSTGAPLTTLFPHVNYLRIMVCGFGTCAINGSSGGSQPTSITYPSVSNFTQIASWCQSAKVACEFEDHNSNGSYWEGSNLAIGQVASYPPSGSLLTSMTTFWAAMATQFKNNPYVWFGSLNEIGGKSYSQADLQDQSRYHLALYNAIRGTGNNNIIDFCAGNGCGNPGTMGPQALLASDYAAMHNVTWFTHAYLTDTAANIVTSLTGSLTTPQGGGPGCYGWKCAQLIQSADGVMPVIYNEFGPGFNNSADISPSSTAGAGITGAMTLLQANGIGSGSFVYFNPNGPGNSADFNQVNNGGTIGATYSLSTWGGYVAATIAANPYPGGTGTVIPSETLTVNSIAAVAQNTTFTASGTISGVSSAPTLQYADNGGAWLALPSGAQVNTTTFSFSHPGMASNSAATVSVRDANNPSVTATGPPFVVTGAASPNGTTIAPGVGSFTDGTYVYTITAAGAATRNDIGAIPSGSGTGAGEWYNGLVYFQDGGTKAWYTWSQATGFVSAAAPGTVSVTEAFTINPITAPAANTPFTVSGSIVGLSSAPLLQYQNSSGAWLPLPGTAGATRNGYNQPGGNGSVWNTPFGNGATWSNAYANNICNVNLNGGTCYGNINTVANYGVTEYIATATDPQFTFTASTNGRTVAPDNGATLTATMHVPQGAVSGGPYGSGACTDCAMVLMDPTNYPNRQYTFGNQNIPPPGLQPGQGPFQAYAGEWDDVTSDTYGEDYETGLTGFNLGNGLINACDVTASCNPDYPKIKHGFRISIGVQQVSSNAVSGTNNVLNPSGWPDRLEDYQAGVTTYLGSLPFGYTLGIPLTTTMPSGLDANCQGFFWSLQHYPTIMRDTNASGVNYYVDQVGDTSSYISSVRGCLNTLVSKLQVLTNQHQGGQSFTTQPANGPGIRSDTGPLPLGTGSGGNVTALTFSFTDPGFAVGVGNTVSIRDANNTSISATSNVFTVGGGTPSPNNTVVTSTSGSITDAAGNIWSFNTAGQVVLNGAADTSTSNINELAYVNSVVWDKTTGNLWRSNPTAVAGAWTPANGTSVSPLFIESPSGTVITTIGPAITDAQGNTFALITGAQVSVNGGAGSGTNIIELAYVNHTAWRETNTLLWSSYASGTWSATTGVSPLIAEIVAINNLPSQPAGLSFTVSGTVTNVSATPTLQYQDNVGAWQPFPVGSTVTLQGNGTPTFADYFTALDVSDSGGAPAATAVTITATPIGQSLADGSGNTWSIVGGVAYKNGAPAGSSVSVAELVYLSGTVYQETTSNTWYSWSGTTWVSSSNPLAGGATGMWMNHYAFGGSEYTLSYNTDLQYYSSSTRTPFWQPFTLQNNGAGPGLVITTATTPQASWLAGQSPANPLSLPYNSGMISSSTEGNGVPTSGLFDFQYGYVEMQALLPGGSGMWAGFVLYPLTGSGELDIIETGGSILTNVYSTIHSATPGDSSTHTVPVTDYTVNRHVYGVDWEPDFITWYVDHVQTAQVATPPDFIGKKYYLDLVMEIQGNPLQGFDGVPNASTVFPALMFIDWVKLWPNFAASQALIAGTTATWSFTHPAMPASLTNTISVRDAANITAMGSSNGFATLNLEAISVNAVGNQTVNVPFTVTGNIANVTATPTLQYQNNNGTWLALPTGAAVSQTAFSFTNPGLPLNAAATVNVRDANSIATTATATFSVTPVVTTAGAGWNAADTSASVSLSNNTQTATSTAAQQGGSRASLAHSTGKYCFDTTLNTVTPNTVIGLSNTGFALGATVPTITASPAGQVLTDASGNRWTIVSGEAYENGAPPNGQFSSNVAQLSLVAGVIWQENTTSQWYYWSGTAWIGASAPAIGTSALGATATGIGFYPAKSGAPQSILYNGVQVLAPVIGALTATSGGSLTDSAGNVWTLVSTAVYLKVPGGTATYVPASNGTAVFAIVNGLYYGQSSTTGAWYTYSLTTQIWTPTSAPVLVAGSIADVSGDPVTVCDDLDAHLEWVSDPVMRATAGVIWNSSTTANPATGIGGVSFNGLICPCFPTFVTQDNGTQVTIGTVSPLSLTLPTGFLAWQTAPVIIHHPFIINLGQNEHQPINDNWPYVPARYAQGDVR